MLGLGNGAAKSSTTPQPVIFPDAIRICKMTAGFEHVLVLADIGTVYGFGANSHGQCGIGTSSSESYWVSSSQTLQRNIAGSMHTSAYSCIDWSH